MAIINKNIRGSLSRAGIAVVLAVILASAFSCVPAPEKRPVPPPEEKPIVAPPKEKLSLAEQNEKAMEVFEQILELTLEPDRASIVPQMESLYAVIISEYPESPLAEDSYFRLIKMSLDDYSPPRVEEAKRLYKEFGEKYPSSKLKAMIDDTVVRSYYKYGLWREVLEFTTPAVREYVKTGNLSGPFHLFLYSEAKMNLGDAAEARKGYNIIIEFFPASSEAAISKKRLEEIK